MPKKTVMVINILQMVCIGPVDIVVETQVKNCSKVSKEQLQMQMYMYFVYVYEVIIKSYLNFITCLYFPLALI